MPSVKLVFIAVWLKPILDEPTDSLASATKARDFMFPVSATGLLIEFLRELLLMG